MIQAGSERQSAVRTRRARSTRLAFILGGPALLAAIGIGVASTWSGSTGAVAAILVANAALMLAGGLLVRDLVLPRRRATPSVPRKGAIAAKVAWRRLSEPVRRPLPCAAGDYVVVGKALYHLEYVGDGEALAEDCRSGRLTELTRAQLADASVVTRSSHPADATTAS